MTTFNDTVFYGGKTPCLGCTKRCIGCHSECELYIEWCNKREKIIENKESEKPQFRDWQKYRPGPIGFKGK